MKRFLLLSLLCLTWCTGFVVAAPQKGRRPNVILIITDDQGYGDLGCHGNPVIKTPNLDKLARQGIDTRFFYVCSLCAPTRASLMTGRYHYRTGVTSVHMGRSLMHTDEVTLAESLRAAGYHTGIFGKWHLGDSYPMRAIDQGVEEALVHLGGGMTEPSGPPGNTSYWDPVLNHNGKSIQTKGYCSDLFTDGAIEFVVKHRHEPFFVYLAFNCPHSPYQIDKKYSQPYEQMNLKPADFPAGAHPLEKVSSATAKVYGMITNIDENLGRLFAKLDELGLRENTLIMFVTDNGGGSPRSWYNGGMRGGKCTQYEGGLRVPLLIRWPERIKPGQEVDQFTAHIDIMPTILEACGTSPPEGVKLDGRSILPLLLGRKVDWPDRTFFSQHVWCDTPVPYAGNIAVRTRKYKLVHHGGKPGADPAALPLELYDMESDPLETRNIAADHPQVVRKMCKDYEAWFADVGRDRGYEAPRVLIGTPHEEVTMLTAHDWRGLPGRSRWWHPHDIGCWEIGVPSGGVFEIRCKCNPTKRPAVAHLTVQGLDLVQDLKPGATDYVFKPISLKASPAERLVASIVEQGVEKPYGARYVYIKR